MKTTDLFIFLVFVVIVIWHSSQVWTNPEGFVSRMRRIRDSMYRYSFGLLIPKWVKEFLDSNPRSEIILARVMFIFIYLLIFYVAIVSFSSASY